MVNIEMLGDELILGTDIIVKGDFGKSCGELCIGRRGGLTVSEECWNDDEVLREV